MTALDDLRQALSVLLRKGWALEEEISDNENFGNSAITLRRDNVRIQVSQDRGQVGMDVAAAELPRELFDVGLFLEFLGPERADSETSGDLESKLFELDARFDEVAEALSPARYRGTRLRIHQLELQRAQSLFGLSRPSG